MGLAELVPGVSGGTIAFISGIYYRLVGALASFGPRSLTMLRHPSHFWQHHQMGFLVVLAAGMGTGILIFARLIGFMLEAAAPVLWAFFRCHCRICLSNRYRSQFPQPFDLWRLGHGFGLWVS